MAPRVSVVVNTLNEEANLPWALRSVSPWADEIIVVDMHSDDNTAQIARDFGAKVFFHERTTAVDGARAFAIEQATGDWVLLLDADELVPAALSKVLLDIAGQDQADVVKIPWLNYLLGSPLLHTGWGPRQDQHTRFFKPDFLRATDSIHNFLAPVPTARVAELPYVPGHAVVHFNYVDVSHFLEKLNRYTCVEAVQAFKRGERSTLVGTVLNSSKEFFRRYVRSQGYRDGWRGFYLSLIMAFYRVITDAKMKELEMLGSREAVLASNRTQASEVIATYSGVTDPGSRA